MKDGALYLAKMSTPLRFVWSWPEVDPDGLDPTSVTVARDPAGRWFVTFHVDAPDPAPRPENDVIAIEDLNVAGMVRNRWLARSISCTGWAEFRSMLEYKAQRHGRTVIAVDRWYPSSKTCSGCGHLLADLSLSTRMWQCPSCGARHDRDINAAKNILAAGLAAGTRVPAVPTYLRR